MSTALDEPGLWKDTTSYERWFESSLGRAYGERVNATVRPWVVAAAPRLVVDVGCGPGVTAAGVLPGGTARLIELDCSFAMARRALERFRAEGREIASVVGSCSRLPLASGSVDLVLCVNCLEFVDDRAHAFRELRRVLRPGGTAVIGVLNAGSPWELTRRLKAPFMPPERNYYKRGRFFHPAELRENLAASGLELEELACAVHFPPVQSPLAGAYDACERAMGRLMPSRGAVLLSRSVAP